MMTTIRLNKLLSPLPMQGRRCHKGSTLMEVLVALVVLSFGLLGQAGLQAASLKANQGAMLRSHATTLAYDVLDRMRANPTVASTGGYDLSWGSNTVTGGSVATNDILQWKTQLEAVLPGGDARICRAAMANVTGCDAPGVGNFMVVDVRWIETDEANQDRILREPMVVVGQL